jgi:mono/diheme cytochrome c family protein
MPRATWAGVGMLTMVGMWTGSVASSDRPVRVVAPQVSTAHLVDGALLYQGYCAPCHGEQGKGDGPLAEYLSRAPLDLTTIALQRDGAFPTFWVEDFIAGRGRALPPGRDQMPNWGRILRTRSASDAVYRLKLRNLVEYLRTLQVK